MPLFSSGTLYLNGAKLDLQGLRSRALFAMLMLDAPKAFQRKDLADALWPNASPSKGRASLRQTISEIKKACVNAGIDPDFLEGAELGGSRWQVFTELDEIDQAGTSVEAFESYAAFICSDKQMLSDLDGIGEWFDDWLIRTRTRLVKSIQTKLHGLHQDLDQSPKLRILAADTALHFNEYDESAVRAKMIGYAALDENGAALKIYADFVDLLDQDLGAEPSLRTQDAAVQIKLAADASATSEPQASGMVQLATRSLLSLAVLPFEAMGSAPLDRFVILGILDQLTCLLAMHKVPAVISSNSTRSYLGQAVRARDVGSELGVTYVVTGSTRTDGDRVAVAVQLCEATTEHVIWSWVQTCRQDEIIQVNSTIAQRISSVLHPSIDAAELSRTWNMDTGALEPYHLVLRAKDRMFRLTYKGFAEAGGLLAQAIEKGPDFAPAHALLADWYSIRFWQKWSDQPEQDFDLMNEHVQRAMSLAPGNGRIMAMWGHFKVVLERNYDAAIDLFNEALTIFPNDSETLSWSVPTLAYSGHAEQAVARAELAMRLSPHDPFLFRNEHFLSIAYYAQGDFDRAAQYGLSSFKRVPTYTSNIRTTIASLVAADRKAELPELLAAHANAEPDFGVARFIPNHGFRDDLEKERYGARLIAAGMAP